MGNVREIGGGQELIDIAGINSGALEQYKTQLGLLDLKNKIGKAPAELAKAQADAQIANHQVTQFAMADQLQLAELNSKQGNERRAQGEYVMNGLKTLPTIFGQNFKAGELALAQVLPGGHAVDNKDGTADIMFRAADGQLKSVGMVLDPRKVSDPEKLKSMEDTYRKEWSQSTAGYQTVHEFYQNFKSSNALASGAGDVAVIYSYMKMLDRNNQVREGQVATAEQAPGISNYILNLYNRAVSEKAPILGDANSNARKMFSDAAASVYSNARADVLQQGQFYHDVALRSNLDPRNVITPVGDINYDLFSGKGPQAVSGSQLKTLPGGNPAPKESAAAAPPPAAGKGGALEAGILPTGANPNTPAPPKASDMQVKPSQQLDDMMSQLLAPMMRRPRGKSR